MRHAVRLGLAGLFLAAAVAAQSDNRPASLEGVVKNQKTGDVLPDVRVTLSPEAAGGTPRTVTTDDEGRFSIPSILAGRYSITAARTLFFRPRRNSGLSTVTLSPGQLLRDVQIQLLPTGVISGRILNENREPVRAARVEAWARRYGVWVTEAQATTDDRGDYRLFNLQPGTFYVRAVLNSPALRSAPLYYPGVLESRDAVALQLEPAAEVGAIDVVLRRIPEFSVQLQLGEGAGAFTIQIRNSRFNEPITDRPLQINNDTLRISRMAPGTYDIFLQAYTPRDVQPRVLTFAGKIPVHVANADVDLGRVTIPPVVTVTGKVVAAEPLPEALDLRRLAVTLRAPELSPTFGVTGRGNANPSAFSDDGSFAVPGVPPSRYEISMSGLPPSTYLVSARAGGREVLDSGYEVTGNPMPLELRLGGPGSVGAVEGAVTNARGEPVPEATVLLVPSPDRRRNTNAFRSAITDQTGAFSIRAVFPGEYKVFAWEDVEPGAWRDPEFLAPLEGRGETLRVQPGARHAATVRVQ